jgi:gamma-glutamylcyclotransferase (GGCT)/AIG2-like uncharacterized protein YtfP
MLVFQYGSNVDESRLNGGDRLNGSAALQGLAVTVDRYDLVFNVWSSGQQCAVANLVEGTHAIYGAVYMIADHRVLRGLKRDNEKTLDEIEGEGRTYRRVQVGVIFNGERIAATTYVGILPDSPERRTTQTYASHIIKGLEAVQAPPQYVDYARGRIAASLGCAY